ncbi:hypothetical protein F4779DRAFT_633255 [Xylariaceae sp. FL0662B]|nr:hypothetical protein F4779DRAFT_633255 [Xylariaceae sp. FL0662B]
MGNNKPSFYANCITTVGGFVAVALRLYARKLTKAGLGWDDGLIMVSSPLAIALYALSIYLWGAGYRYDILMEERYDAGVDSLPLVISCDVIFVLCSCLTKLSIVFSYVRLFIQPNFRLICHVVSFLVVVWSIANFIQVIVFWKIATSPWEATMNGQRFTGKGVEIGICVFNIIANGVIIVLPIRPVWKLRMKKNKRVALIVLFSLGLGVIIVTVIRLGHVIDIEGNEYNINTDMNARSMHLQVLEPNLAIMLISIPMLHPLWHKFRDSCMERRRRHHDSQRISNSGVAWRVSSSEWPGYRKQVPFTYKVGVDVDPSLANELVSENVVDSNECEGVLAPPACITVKKSFEISWEAAVLHR